MKINLSRLTKINWRTKLNDPIFYVQILASFSLPITAYLGIKATDITSWGMLFENIIKALNNPYCVGVGLVSVFNALIDSENPDNGLSVENGEDIIEKIEK